MAVRLIAFIGCALAVLLGTASARQLAFSRDGLSLHYAWQYETAPMQAFTVQLPAETALPPWSAWRSQQADAFVFQQLLRDAREQYPDVAFRYQKTGGGSTISFQTLDQQLLPQIDSWLAQQQKTLFNAYLDQHYYKIHGNSNTNPTNHCVNVAQLRWHNDFTPSTSDIKRCQASLQASRISSYPLKVRFANACCRNQLQTCSTGFNSGE